MLPCRCFASAPYSMATYDRLVQYTRAEHLAQPAPQSPPPPSAAAVEPLLPSPLSPAAVEPQPTPRSSSPEQPLAPRRSRWDETRPRVRRSPSESPRRHLHDRRRARSRSAGRGGIRGHSPAASPRSRRRSPSITESERSLSSGWRSSDAARRRGRPASPRQLRPSRDCSSSESQRSSSAAGVTPPYPIPYSRPAAPREPRRSRSSISPPPTVRGREGSIASDREPGRRREAGSRLHAGSHEGGARRAAPQRWESGPRQREAGAEGLGIPKRSPRRREAGAEDLGLPERSPRRRREARSEVLGLPEPFGAPLSEVDTERGRAGPAGPSGRAGPGRSSAAIAVAELQQLREEALSKMAASRHAHSGAHAAAAQDVCGGSDRWQMD